MPLAMSRPWKHPKTGIYQLRKVVPDDLRKLVGKREEKLSLQTRDPAEAKVRHAKALAELEARWANLRTGPKSLTEREAHELAADSYGEFRWRRSFESFAKFQSLASIDIDADSQCKSLSCSKSPDGALGDGRARGRISDEGRSMASSSAGSGHRHDLHRGKHQYANNFLSREEARRIARATSRLLYSAGVRSTETA
ncbi:hypothetical protein FBZ93_118148 [Bradyrhizobium macuxiense]|uniref:DUF6538 domain-containing protein n=1 Tax=Bradyrhizobium macuxiense TaxID=1755647 RepID=A0A560KYY5_9BRAD|nr:DUF6538 domain-containing protein [Bradyrhizobium macuxiense]TWB88468.1 hypothetical protein FBZ93_118148 [Bradyrhizobium macuxiense]